MNTIKTISINRQYHLFEDLLEDDYIYLELEDVGECIFEDWTEPQGSDSRVVIKIAREDFEEMIDAYQSQNC